MGKEEENMQPSAQKPPDLVPAYRVMWDWERDDFHGISRPNLPGVFRCGELEDASNGHYVRLDKAWQFFWFDLCSKIYYDGRCHDELSRKEYKWLANRWTILGATKTAFTNQKGLNDFRNYVTDENEGTEDARIYTLVCGGASLAGTLVRGRNGWMLKVEHFDGNKPPPPVDSIDPYTDLRVFFATTIVDAKVHRKYSVAVFDEETDPPGRKVQEFDEGYRVNPFPQFMKGEGAMDCPVPLLATKDIYFPLKYLVAIEEGVKAHPYFR
jgi:hypothetical protein